MGLFGTGGNATAQQPQTGSGLFGGNPAQSQTQSQPQPQASQGGGLFSSLAKPAQQTPTLGGSLFGQPAQQNQQNQQKPSLL